MQQLDLEPCGFTLSGESCQEVGDHFCEKRALHAKAFIETALVHTKGKYARRKFVLRDWQYKEIIAPVFGNTEWSVEHECYRRGYRIAYLTLARKNGKSEILAAIMLYILFCDGEYGAELFSVATDRKQAALIFDVAKQMILLNPSLAKLCKVVDSQKRIIYRKNNSVYQVLANDAASALGSNPSAVAADELLAWPTGDLWDALRTGMGSMARVQPLIVATTTAGNDSESFGGLTDKEMAKIADDPSRAKHIFANLRNTPMNADPFEEKNWYYANPALGDFLSLETMREMAKEARNDPTKLNAFRQFQLNQWVSSAVAWMPMHLYEKCNGVVYSTNQKLFDAYAGQQCWFGLDLASSQDLTSMCYLFPKGDGTIDLLWRHYAPEAAVEKLDRMNQGRFSAWAKKGWITVTEGDVLDYDVVYADIEADAVRFEILGGDADQWTAPAALQEIEKRAYLYEELFAYKNDFSHMSPGMHLIFDMVTNQKLRHHANPLARFCFDACEARIAAYDPDVIRPDKPNRNTAAKRIDAVPAAIMAANAWSTRGMDGESVYESREALIL